MDIKKVIIDLFATHPKVDAFYKTSDGQFFEGRQNAEAHSQRLNDRGIATVTREQANTITAAAIADASLAHPEQTTALTAEQLAEQTEADKKAQAALEALLNPVEDSDKAAADAAEADRIAAEKVAIDKAAADAAEADRIAAEKVATDKAAADAAEADRIAAEKVATDKAAAYAAEADRIAAENKKKVENANPQV
jgi:hypothetical protein